MNQATLQPLKVLTEAWLVRKHTVIKRYPDSLRLTKNAELIFRLLQTSRFSKHHAFTSPVLMFFKNSRQTYALHLMNSLLNIFCYIIPNVGIRKNLHRVWLVTQKLSRSTKITPRSSVSYVYKGHGMFFPINLGQSSQDSENLSRMPKQSGACTQVGQKPSLDQSGASS